MAPSLGVTQISQIAADFPARPGRNQMSRDCVGPGRAGFYPLTIDAASDLMLRRRCHHSFSTARRTPWKDLYSATRTKSSVF